MKINRIASQHAGFPFHVSSDGLFLQPDLGTALVFIIIFGMLYFAGITGVFLPVVCTDALLPFMDPSCYQKCLVVFFNPELDPLGYGYQLKQSMMLGSGK